MAWGLPIVAYLFLAGLGAGSYVTSIILAQKNKDAKKTLRSARIISLLAVGVGLLLLMIDAEAGMKNPLRFFYLVTNFNSVMTWGTLILGVFSLISFASVILDFTGKKVPRALEITGAIAALFTAGYAGVLLGVVETYPLWHSPLLPLLFAISALSTGIAMVIVSNSFFSEEREFLHGFLLKTRVTLPVFEAAVIAILLFALSTDPLGTETVSHILSGSSALLFWVFVIAIGILVPFMFATGELTKRFKVNARLIVLSETFVLVGGFALRLLILTAALPI